MDTTADDTYIDTLIVAATKSCEEYTNRFFITTEITQYCDKWSEASELYKSPVQTALFNVKYYDADNVLQTVLVADYIIDNSAMPTRLALAPSQSWPTIADRINAIEINYRVGVDSADDVDGAIKQAVLLTIGHWYQNSCYW